MAAPTVTYSQPVYSYRHKLREIRAAAIDTIPALNSSTPQSRLWDTRSRDMVRFAADAAAQIVRLRRDSSPFIERTNRIIIPPGHNMASDREVRVIYDDDADFSGQYLGRFPDGFQEHRVTPWSGPIVFDLADSMTAAQLRPMTAELQFYESDRGDPVELGEIWWTDRISPGDRGIEPRWRDESEPVQITTTTRSGATYSLTTGEPRRRFSIDHRALDGEDLALYDEMYRAVRDGSPFWFEHSSSGSSPLLISTLVSAPGGSAPDENNNVAAFGPLGVDPYGGSDPYYRMSSTTPGATSIAIYSSHATKGWTVTDWRNCVVQFDLLVEQSLGNWADASDSAITFSILREESASSPATVYTVSRPLGVNEGGANWIRCFIDLEDPDIVIGNGAGDLSSVLGFRISWVTANVGDLLSVGRVNLVRKNAVPVLVQIEPGTRPRRTQDTTNPKAIGPKFRWQMDLVEVTA